jgi:hypothetical protein
MNPVPLLCSADYLLLNMDAIQTIMAITTTTAKMPTIAPALNIPVITEQLLKAVKAKTTSKMFIFFMIKLKGVKSFRFKSTIAPLSKAES